MKTSNVLKAFGTALLALSLAACGSSSAGSADAGTQPAAEKETLTVSATANPHEVILNEAKPILLEKYNVDLQIIETEDYYTPNRAVSDGDADANFFQHVPFFDNEKAENGYKISNVGGIHIEPFGFYSRKYTSLDELPDGAHIITSNSVADHGRVLEILAKAGLITLKDGVDSLSATKEDIIDNPHNFDFSIEVNPEQLTNALDDAQADLVAINGNYAIEAGLKVSGALAAEKADSEAAQTYANILVVKEGNENLPKVQALSKALTSDAIRDYINNTYDGAVVPIF